MIRDFGDLHTAKQNGIIPVKAGIKFTYRDLTGSPIKYLPSKAKQRSTKYAKDRAKDRDAQNPYSDESKHLAKTYARYRYAPEYIPSGKGKYKGPSKQDAHFQPLFLTNSIIDAYKKGDKIDTLYLTEGEAKATILGLISEICTGGFGGVSVYWLTEMLKEFIRVCQPENVVILYDSDALDISKSWENEPINKRPLSFLNSARKFSKQFFTHIKELYSKTDYKPNLFFARNIETENQKAVDDMLINLTDQNGIIDALQSKESGKYFDYVELTEDNYTTKLQQYFHLSNINEFYNLHKEQIIDQAFDFDHCGHGRIKWQHNGQNLQPVGVDPEIIMKLSKGQKLEDIAPQLIEIIKNQIDKKGRAKIALNAKMGTGKTYTTINQLAPALQEITGVQSAMICPLNMLVQQTAAAYKVEGLTDRKRKIYFCSQS